MFEDILVGLVVFFVVLFWNKWQKIKKSNSLYVLPAGPKPVALLGHTWTYLGVKDVISTMKVYQELAGESKIIQVDTFMFGKIIIFSRADLAQVMLTSKNILHKTEIIYAKTTALPDGLITNSGEEWRCNRKLMSPMFSTKMLHKYLEIFNKLSSLIVDDFRVYLGTGKSFHCAKIFSVRIYDSILENLCSLKKRPFSDKYLIDFMSTVNRETNHTSETLLKLYSDPIRRAFGYNKSAAMFKQQIHEIANTVMNEHKKTSLSKNDLSYENCGRNILDVIAHLEHKNFAGELNTILVAGYETTTITLSYVCAMLALHPRYQELVYKEIIEILGDKDREIRFHDLSHMKLLEKCINETLRLYPAVPGFGRKLIQDTQFGEYFLPKNTHLFLILPVLHRDPEHWEKPDQFYPEHFDPDMVNRRHPFAFVPFAAGPRQCLGYRYAMLSIKCVLSRLLRFYVLQTDMKFSEVLLNRFILLDASHIRVQLISREN